MRLNREDIEAIRIVRDKAMGNTTIAQTQEEAIRRRDAMRRVTRLLIRADELSAQDQGEGADGYGSNA